MWRRYLRFFGPDVDRDVEDELDFHLSMRQSAFEAEGMSAAEARQKTLRRFGSVAAVRLSLTRSGKTREKRMRLWDSIERVGQDITFAVRQLVRAPGFTVVAVVTLALGIGVNTAIYSVVDGTLFRALPYENPEELVRIHGANQDAGQTLLGVSRADFEDLSGEAISFEGMVALRSFDINVMEPDHPPTDIPATVMSPGLFSLLRVAPVVGRSFNEEDHESEAEVIVISHRLWHTRYGGDSSVVGRVLHMYGSSYAIVGIMPPGFSYPSGTDIWRPTPRPTLQEGDNESLDGFGRDWRNQSVLARLAPGVSVERASLELATVAKRLALAYPKTNTNITYWAHSALDYEVGSTKSGLLLLLAAVGAILLIACANVANLLLARGTHREQEMAVRTALGAGRRRLVRQLLTESVVLALLGGAAGVVLGYWTLTGLMAALPTELPRMENVTLDARVIAITALVTIGAGTLVGLLPALKASHPDLVTGLKAGSRGSGGAGRHRIQRVLVVGEIALSTVLVVSAGLLAVSFIHMSQEEPGFAPENVISTNVNKAAATSPPWDEFSAFFDDVLGRINELPGVQSAALSFDMPMHPDRGFEAWFQVPGLIESNPGERPTADLRPVSPGFFATVGIPLLRGRGFTAADGRDSPGVVIVNETFAARYFGSTDPIGYRLHKNQFWGEHYPSEHEIVGIVADVKADGLGAGVDPAMYFPYNQTPMGNQQLIIRTTGDPTTAIAAVKREVWAVDPTIAMDRFDLLTTVIRESVAGPRFAMQLVGGFALLALVLAAVGIYGVMAYAVGERTKEMGLRRALGAEERGLLWLVLRQGLTMTAAGVALGLVGAWFASGLLSSTLFGVSPTDPLTFAVVAAILGLVATAACIIPARRAMRIDPMVALRNE